MTPFQATARAIFLDLRRYYTIETAAWRSDAAAQPQVRVPPQAWK